MRIVRDVDGDIWEEVEPDLFKCRTNEDAVDNDLQGIEYLYGPVFVYGSKPKPSADNSVYRVTYTDGFERHGNRRVLAGVLGTMHRSWRKPRKVERASKIEWADVTTEFLKDS